jgi:uncharacterized integral membrane protein
MLKVIEFLIALPVTVVLLIFAWSNAENVKVSLWPILAEDGNPLTIENLSLGMVVLIALLVGFLLGVFVAWLYGFHWRRKARIAERRANALERELSSAQAQMPAGLPAIGTSRF